MAQANRDEKNSGPAEIEKSTSVAGFKFNAHAPEFVPRFHTQLPVSGYVYPWFHFFGDVGGQGTGWCYFEGEEPFDFVPDSHGKSPSRSKNAADIIQKTVKQVEYQFTDANLVASDYLMKLMSKDPQGYVSISAVTSSKKIKSLGVNNHMLVSALRASTKLVVSEDGRKVRRKHLFTERDKEEIQARTVIVENLPEDYSCQNLEKMFSAVGSVKNVQICRPQDSNATSSSKGDLLISNKLHALVEYENVDQAEKAVEKLHDERNWRKGLRVRVMLRRSPRSVIRSIRTDYDFFDVHSGDDVSPASEPADSPQSVEQPVEHNFEENPNGGKKGWVRGRGKARGVTHIHNDCGILSSSPQFSGFISSKASGKPLPRGSRMSDSPRSGILPSSLQSSGVFQIETLGKQTTRGPRMPDGTRGFTMGRGKPLKPGLGCLSVEK